MRTEAGNSVLRTHRAHGRFTRHRLQSQAALWRVPVPHRTVQLSWTVTTLRTSPTTCLQGTPLSAIRPWKQQRGRLRGDDREANALRRAMIVLAHEERLHQIMRIAERLSFYDHKALNMDSAVAGPAL